MVHSKEFANKLDFVYKMRQRVISARKKTTGARVSTETPSSRSKCTAHHSLSIRRFWGKGERWERKREGAEGEKLFSPSPLPHLKSPLP